MSTTPKQVATAWHSVTDSWIVRRNKMHNSRQWEVVHDWGGDLVSDDTMKIVGRYDNEEAAEAKAERCENEARGTAVLHVLGLRSR